jgi:hypothetical protein
LSEDTDAFVITSNRQTFFFPETENLNFGDLNAALASQSRTACPYKALSFQFLRHPQYLSNFQLPKFKFSVSGKKNVRLFEVMTKTSVLSEKTYLKLWLGSIFIKVFQKGCIHHCPVGSGVFNS